MVLAIDMRMMKNILIWILIVLHNICCGQASDTSSVSNSTKSLLSQPFDLQAFKKKKGGANSSGNRKYNYFFKSGKGVYWSFFLFPPIAGYIGEVPSKDIHLEDGLEITTFQPQGKNQNKYIDPEETLIQVIERYNDIDLPELAFVGLNKDKIKKKLGQWQIQKDNCIVYFHLNYLLTLHIKDGTVNWVKYTRLNFPVTKDNIPADLLKDKFD